MNKPNILIIGASARAAAESANAAGFHVYAADLFADRDLQSIATCHRVTNYPDEFATVQLQLQDSHPRIPCIYTGALENYPDLIQRLEAQGLVYGNSAETLRRVRDPFRLQTFFNGHNVPFPTTKREPPRGETEWLRKSLRSAGGQHVSRCLEKSLGHGTPSPAESYYQQSVDGDVCSAAYIADGKTAHLLGTSDMLVGQQWLGCRGFVYCGSMVRFASGDELADWRRLGELVATEFQLIGAFGIDAIVRDGQLVPLEINPRYTASMELFERAVIESNAASATSLETPHPVVVDSVVQQHVAACQSKPVNVRAASNRHFGKAILYATDPVNIPDSLNSPNACRLADIPSPGPIQNGYPILTLLSQGTTRVELLDNLRAAAAHVYSQVRPGER